MIKTIQTKIFLYFLPLYYIYNMLLDVVFIRGGAAGVVINIMIIGIFAFFTIQNKYNHKFIYVYVWILFNIVLICVNSSDIIFSLKEFFKNVIGILCLPLSFLLISNSKQIILFLKIVVIIMLLYILNLIMANVLGWGNAYGGDSDYAVQAGASIVTGSMTVIMALMVAPLVLYSTNKKNTFLFIWIATFISSFFIFKRTNIAGLILGYMLIFLMYNFHNNKFRIKKSKTRIFSQKLKTQLFTSALMLFGVFISLFGDIVIAQLEVRQRKFEVTNLEKEGRIIEWYLVKDVILNSSNTNTYLFGKEPYNTVGNYGLQTMRNIHGDFSMVLFSTGVVGSVLYWLMQLYIVFVIMKYCKKRYLQSPQDILLFSIYLASSLIWFIFCFSATLRYVLVSSLYYMIHGAILRYFWNKHNYQNLTLYNTKTNENSNCYEQHN